MRLETEISMERVRVSWDQSNGGSGLLQRFKVSRTEGTRAVLLIFNSSLSLQPQCQPKLEPNTRRHKCTST